MVSYLEAHTGAPARYKDFRTLWRLIMWRDFRLIYSHNAKVNKNNMLQSEKKNIW